MDMWADPDYIRDEIENDPPTPATGASTPLAPVAILIEYGLWPNVPTYRDTDMTDAAISEVL